MKKIIITGAAGFIGFHACQNLLKKGYRVIGIDNINDYYDVNLKYKRLEILKELIPNSSNWEFIKADLINKTNLTSIFNQHKPEIVINLAAQAGVRYSLINPCEYINSNIVGFTNLMECCKELEVKNFLYGSSSSVYGGNTKIPFSEEDRVDHPVSIYGATKKTNELIAHTYSHLYNIPTTGLRFFTVYGPWGRPDMAPMIFADAIINEKPIKIFNFGEMSRSFTYIDDVIKALEKLIEKPASINKDFKKDDPKPSTSWSPYRVFNIGNQKSINLMDFILSLEKELNKKAIKEFAEMQQGDVKDTSADNSKIINWLGDIQETPLDIGVKKFVKWYKSFYK
ncbi:NAD-dependent epimerase/dehydratase family protein [Prochlorococcus marinus]|uniref:NAD-dependent epimerase/dehydratase family protein n=1 Tax=Prochlorococcus marinus TaxID=1219 RepID=UPI0005176F56|nr:NAD-dependent epimerase/dehydratase family protein [Prochlorococcus marinus]|tara:strand:- start:2433 stop:3452 length:1020 start_codon:yes stop_codon:yes gene_type:complete